MLSTFSLKCFDDDAGLEWTAFHFSLVSLWGTLIDTIDCFTFYDPSEETNYFVQIKTNALWSRFTSSTTEKQEKQFSKMSLYRELHFHFCFSQQQTPISYPIRLSSRFWLSSPSIQLQASYYHCFVYLSVRRITVLLISSLCVLFFQKWSVVHALCLTRIASACCHCWAFQSNGIKFLGKPIHPTCYQLALIVRVQWRIPLGWLNSSLVSFI